MNIQHQDHRRRLRALVHEFVADVDFHDALILSCPQAPHNPGTVRPGADELAGSRGKCEPGMVR